MRYRQVGLSERLLHVRLVWSCFGLFPGLFLGLFQRRVMVEDEEA